MKGFMRQRGASWELRVCLGHDPLTGKKRYATRSVRGGKREAQTVLAEMITEAERGLTVRTTATVGELLSAWIGFAAPDFSPKTVKETRGYIARSLMPTLGSSPLAKLKPADLDAFYRRLLTSGGPAAGRWRRAPCDVSTAFFGERSTRASSGDGSASTRRPLRHRRVSRRRTSNRRRPKRSDGCSGERRWSRRTSAAT